MGKTILIYIVTLLALPFCAFGLEPLSERQMKGTTAQAGISIAMEDVTYYQSVDAFQLANPYDPDTYIEFQNIESFTTLDVGMSDTDGDGLIGFLTLDMGTVNDAASPIDGKALLYLTGSDIDLRKNTTIGNINYCGTDIGSAAIDTFSMPSFHLILGAHDSGVDMEFGARVTIDQLTYRDTTHVISQPDTLAFTGITFAGTFTDDAARTDGIEDDPTNTTTWQAAGEFTLGDMEGGNPMTLDVAADDTETWVFKDKDGAVTYTADNPRFGSGFIALNVPMEGSIRVEHMKVKNMAQQETDLGAFALDNIKAHKLYIEIPGRGLGAAYK